MARQESSLLALPEPLLLKVLQCCAAGDQRSLFSAARAHPRLHRTAVAALHSITAVLMVPPQLDSVLLFLGKYGRQLDSIHLDVKRNGVYILRQLPPDLQLSSLHLEGLQLQLQPGVGFRGVMGAAAELAALTHLHLGDGDLLDGDAGLAAALVQLPAGLQHLIDALMSGERMCSFPTTLLCPLQELTFLKLSDVFPTGSGRGSRPLQPLQAMTRLDDLFLDLYTVYYNVPASVLSGAHGMTSLQIYRMKVDPTVLAGKTKLQHVALHCCGTYGGGTGLPLRPLLANLQDLQQLTHLHMSSSLEEIDPRYLPTAAFSALTASSKLQYLDLACRHLPADVWQHVFPIGRQLPHLTSLRIANVRQPGLRAATAPESSRLVSCCPGLQSLDLGGLQCSAELLAPLQGLSGLHTLRMGNSQPSCTGEGLQWVCQMTWLRELGVSCTDTRSIKEGLFLQLTQLKQLTRLSYMQDGQGSPRVEFWAKGPGDEPVWCQILLYIIKYHM